MSKNIAIKVENLSKQYRLGQVGTGTISHDINRWWHLMRGKEDPYLKIGESNDRTSKGNSEYVWALRDINFEVEKGEVLGIIGKNGAGKSTLLKLLSKVTSPTTGAIKTKGRIASLLEVGTGFHPEMTGRENIYMNGTIMGMSRQEISAKLEEIVEFAGVSRYIDTPVKRYSSGMTVRLGFSIAAHLEPEILIVDEVLAVGDAEFQKKAIGKMQDVSKGEGRTVLFVSHNMASVRALCSRGIILENGEVAFNGNVESCIEYYLNSNKELTSNFFDNKKPKIKSDILEVKVLKGQELASNFKFDEKIIIYVRIKHDKLHKGAVLSMRIKDNLERNVFTSMYELENYNNDNDDDEKIIKITIPNSLLVPNSYRVTIGFHIPNVEIINRLEDIVRFNIEETGSKLAKFSSHDYGCVFVECNWDIIKV